MKVKRGDIYIANLNDPYGSEQARVRPVLVIQITWEINIVQQQLLHVYLVRLTSKHIFQRII